MDKREEALAAALKGGTDIMCDGAGQAKVLRAALQRELVTVRDIDNALANTLVREGGWERGGWISISIAEKGVAAGARGAGREPRDDSTRHQCMGAMCAGDSLPHGRV